MPNVIAILASDIHIESRPSWRSAEPDWFAAMARQLKELRDLSETHNAFVIYGGDIFTRWFAGPELINFAIKHLPKGYSVRGNHDLPNHRHEEVKRSAYWTLVQAKILADLEQPVEQPEWNLKIHPFPWGKEITPLEADDDLVHLAVCHRYVWKDGCGHIGAREEDKASNLRKSLKGYSASLFGDNHMSFLLGKPGQHMLLNPGAFFRRHSDSIDHKPMVGLLHSDGSITPHYLDVSQDLHVEMVAKSDKKLKTDASKVLAGFKSLGKDSLDFRAAIRHELDRRSSDEAVTGLVLRSIEKTT